MKVVALKERAPYESRVAITPDTVSKFIKLGHSVWCENGIGDKAGFNDAEYLKSGAHMSSIPLEIVGDADVILKVQPTPLNEEINELVFARQKSVIVGLLSPFANIQLIQQYAARNITSIAMELIPRVTKAQTMDALSSQSNLVGYRAVIESLIFYNKVMPMMITSAGTLAPTKVLVLGLGVAGLQAAATAKRLGAIVYAYDMRQDAMEQAKSVGAKFLNDVQDDNRKLDEYISKSDIVITAAQILGKSAPKLISIETIKTMRKGSVIVDTSTITGGNVEGSVRDDVININGVIVIGHSNLASNIAYNSSMLYANNLYNFIAYAFRGDDLNIADTIVQPMIVTHNSKMF